MIIPAHLVLVQPVLHAAPVWVVDLDLIQPQSPYLPNSEVRRLLKCGLEVVPN